MIDHVDRPRMAEIRYIGDETVIPDTYDTIELKMDGMYGFLEVCDGTWKIKSRTGMIKAMGDWPEKRDKYILIGEWMKGSHWAKRMRGTMEIEENEFYAFDCLYYNGIDLQEHDLYTRRSYMRKTLSVLSDSRWKAKEDERELLPMLRKVNTWNKSSWVDVWYDYVLDLGYEGIVFKNSLSKFNDKSGWARMKKEIEMDYICVGFEPADEESKYKGLVGAVKGTLIDKDVIVECGGLTDAQRQEYTENAEKYKGRIFTAKGNDWYPSGSIRHPKFREWREDKTHYECSYNQVPYDIRKED